MNKITYEERAKVYADALETYGITGQLMKALEELSEVQIEIHRILSVRPNVFHLAEEIADATIMLEQVRQIFDINEDVCKFMDDKVLRLQRTIETNKYVERKLSRMDSSYEKDRKRTAGGGLTMDSDHGSETRGQMYCGRLSE